MVPPSLAGRRLDHFLAAQLQDQQLTRSRLRGLIRQGLVTVLPTAATLEPAAAPTLKAGLTLKAGDRVAVEVPAAEPVALAAQEIPFVVLHEDDELLVISKPPGVVVHPAAGHRQGTLVNGLLHHCRDLSGISGELRPGIVHRLDKDTSGCLVVAKNDRAHQDLLAQFKNREVEKIYLALLSGKLAGEEGRVEAPIGRHPGQRQKMAVRPVGEGRSALTHWWLRQRFTAGYTLVVLRLASGRTHQIRVHMASLGHPVAGDTLYGKGGERDRRYGIGRQWLHAAELAFRHPASGELLRCRAPLWPDLAQVLAELADG